MSNVFLIGCTHFGHKNMYKFVRKDGTRVRYQFANAKEGDEAIIERWNATVRNSDKVYVLGDVAFHRDDLSTIGKLNGKKILIKGNHDILQLSEYVKYFKDIRATHRLDNEILSHIPIHPSSLWREKKKCYMTNIHAHLHAEVVYKFDEQDGEYGVEPDNRYFSVCVERINYTPISIDEIRNRLSIISKIKEETQAMNNIAKLDEELGL